MLVWTDMNWDQFSYQTLRIQVVSDQSKVDHSLPTLTQNVPKRTGDDEEKKVNSMVARHTRNNSQVPLKLSLLASEWVRSES